MPRSESEIQAEIDALKARGVHPAHKSCRVLRDEMKALSAPVSQSPPAPGAPEPSTTSDVASAVVAPPSGAEARTGTFGHTFVPPLPSWSEPPLWEPEERFIDRLLTDLVSGLEMNKGTLGGVIEKMYERVDAALKLRRILMEVFKDLTPGDNLPSFAKLGRNPSTGNRVLLVSDVPFPGVATEKGPAPAVAPVTDGGMPVRPRPSPHEVLAGAGGFDPRADMRARIDSRPEPARGAPQTATA